MLAFWEVPTGLIPGVLPLTFDHTTIPQDLTMFPSVECISSWGISNLKDIGLDQVPVISSTNRLVLVPVGLLQTVKRVIRLIIGSQIF
jgi:hypothetical protein